MGTIGIGHDPELESVYVSGLAAAIICGVIIMLLYSRRGPLHEFSNDHPWAAIALVIIVPLIVGLLF